MISVKLRDKIDKLFENLPQPKCPGGDASDLLDILAGITDLSVKDLNLYQAQLNSWYNYYLGQAAKKKDDIIESEHEFDDVQTVEMESIDNKLYKSVSERKSKALENNIFLKNLRDNIDLEKGINRRLEMLEKVIEKSMFTINSEIKRRSEMLKGKEHGYF